MSELKTRAEMAEELYANLPIPYEPASARRSNMIVIADLLRQRDAMVIEAAIDAVTKCKCGLTAHQDDADAIRALKEQLK